MSVKNKTARVLIASSEASFQALKAPVKRFFDQPLYTPSLTLARQRLASEGADILVVNAPLPDARGAEECLELSLVRKDLMILLIVGQSVYEQTVYRLRGSGIFVLARPLNAVTLAQALLVLESAIVRQEALAREAKRLSKRLEDASLFCRAKCLLIEREGRTEEEAHRYLEKEAMDRSLTRSEIAREVIGRLRG